MNADTTPTARPIGLDLPALWEFAGVAVPVALTTAFADFLFWDGYFGASVGIFFAGLGLLLFLRRRAPVRMRTWVLAAMLGASCVQSVIGVSLSNVLAALALALLLAGEAFQPQLAGLWARLSEVLFGLATAPARWVGLSATAARGVAGLRGGDFNISDRATLAVKVLLPSVLLLGVFGAIFASGHAVFGELLQRCNQAVIDLWMNLNITTLRVVWWGLVATLALGLFHGRRAPEAPRWWTRAIPRFPRLDARLALWQTGAALVAVNVIFGMVNTLDAVYLWAHSALPTGLNASDYLHEGVNSLIAAVILSAVLIAGMFQQSDAVAGNMWLKRLAHAWVLQNLLLLAGVLRRLMFYTEAYQLTEKRVFVGCFLLLVMVGFLLLAWFVEKRRSFNWLLGQNAVATFTLFFALQFCDVPGWVAHYNVGRWEQSGELDVAYLASLGPTAWPDLIQVARSTRKKSTSDAARQTLKGLVDESRIDWRGYQWRVAIGRKLIFDYVANP